MARRWARPRAGGRMLANKHAGGWRLIWPLMVGAVAALAVPALPAGAATAPADHTATSAARPAPAATGGTLRAWGLDSEGELGDGALAGDSAVPVKVKLPAGVTVTQVRAGCQFTVALTSTGQVLAWGENNVGQLGIGASSGDFVTTPVFAHLPAGTTVTAIRAGCEHVLALTSTGQVLAWGDNVFGQLGDGTITDAAAPVQVALPPGVTVKAISAGGNHSLALASSGTAVYAWGSNQSGQLGDESFDDSDVPAAVVLPSGVAVTGLAAGFFTSYAVTSTRQVLTWGDNSVGQLGDGRAEPRSAVPVFAHLPAGVKVRSVSGGAGQVLALTTTGHVLAWGSNSHGQLGNGTTANRGIPTAISLPGSATASALSAGGQHSLALTTAGTVFAWGRGTEGELGNGTFADRHTPVRVPMPAGLAVTAVASGPTAEISVAIVHKVT